MRASQNTSSKELARDRAHFETDLKFVSEANSFPPDRSRLDGMLMFYQAYLFGGQVAAKFGSTLGRAVGQRQCPM